MNYKIIADAIEFYESKGFKYLEVPWLVPDEIVDATRPNQGDTSYRTEKGHLVGSGEQSFLHLLNEQALAPGRYSCATPCFRNEATLDQLHRNTFFKVELINTIDKSLLGVYEMIQCAEDFLRYSLGMYCKVVPSSSLFILEGTEMDLVEYNTGIELGSYGRRSWNEITWAYGTGLAEPRTSYVLNLKDRYRSL